MVAVTIKTVAKVYFVSMLLLAILVSPLPQLGLALALLAIQLGLAYRQPKSSISLVLVFSSLILAPLVIYYYLWWGLCCVVDSSRIIAFRRKP